ncbi:MAG TPA: hypothetical protein VFC00_37500, partial [Micromonosporaceae bacterium]|nr:hypothetical protein [Micromonosporaceae bacterium]
MPASARQRLWIVWRILTCESAGGPMPGRGRRGRGIGLAPGRGMMDARTRDEVEAYYRDVAPFYDAETADR